jgi:hypothetical protein
MKYSSALFVAAASAAAIGQAPMPDAEGRYTLTAPGIRAQFIPYGATLTNLFVKGEQFNLCSMARDNSDIQTRMASSVTLFWATTTRPTTVSLHHMPEGSSSP